MVDASNLVSYPKSGTTTYSLTGSLSGSLVNGVGYSAGNGGAWVFDGTDDYINFGTQSLISTDFTIEIWVDVENIFKEHYLINVGYNSLSSLLLVLNSTGNGDFGFAPYYRDSAGNVVSYSGGGGNTGRANHIVLTRSGSTNTSYINGVVTNTFSNGTVLASNLNLQLGWAIPRNKSSAYLQGSIYNTRIYNKALTSDEVQQNYQATKDKFLGQNIVTNGLVLNLDAANKDSYPGTGTTWTDLSGNGNNGTLINGPSFLSNVNSGIIKFDGVDDYISRSYNSTFNIRTGLTLSVFFKRNSIFTQLSDCVILSRVPSWYFYDS
jgi:hypothetical protein